MAVSVIIPRLGWTMEEGTFVGWLKKDGDSIGMGDTLFSLEGEKAVEEIESVDSGILRIAPGGPGDGDRVLVGAVVAYLVQPGEAAPFENEGQPQPADQATNGTVSAAASVKQASDAAPAPAGPAKPQAASARFQPPNDAPATRKTISPRARRAARQHGVDWQEVTGTGRTGRIRERDILAASQSAAKTAQPAERRPSRQRGDASSAPKAPAAGAPVSQLRRTIADRMLQSQRSTAPVTLTTTVDVSDLVALRRELKQFSPADEVPSFTDFLIKLTAPCLQLHPLLNSTWQEGGIVASEGVHIGVAVDTESGLLVPVLHDVAALTLREITTRLRDLAARARNRQLKPEEMRGGSFTITNLGTFGIDAFTPIINYPECAVLGVGRIVRMPVVDSADRVVVRDQMTLSLTFDHRIVDGAPAARFLQQLSQSIEKPMGRLLS